MENPKPPVSGCTVARTRQTALGVGHIDVLHGPFSSLWPHTAHGSVHPRDGGALDSQGASTATQGVHIRGGGAVSASVLRTAPSTQRYAPQGPRH